MAIDYTEPPFVHNEQGDRSALQVIVKHDLGVNTLIVVLLLTCVIGFCGWRIGQDQATAEMNGQYMRDVAAKLQINTNHSISLETKLETMKEKDHAK